MPGMNGLQLLGTVKQLAKKTPVVLISGHADDAFILKAFKDRDGEFHREAD